uniref:Uncharacterized protein n=1 Tax=Meloidogyne javanica TaxID=6303 RepID=A0A915LVE7_MELJA
MHSNFAWKLLRAYGHSMIEIGCTGTLNRVISSLDCLNRRWMTKSSLSTLDWLGSVGNPTGACPILGTDAYRPISNYGRVEYQPKDDIESWFYMCHEFFNGALPWDKLPHSSTLDFKIHCRKLGRDLLLSNMPDTFDEILKSIDSSKTKVDYFQISTLLKAALANLSREPEPFSWKKDPTIVHRATKIEQGRVIPGI